MRPAEIHGSNPRLGGSAAAADLSVQVSRNGVLQDYKSIATLLGQLFKSGREWLRKRDHGRARSKKERGEGGFPPLAAVCWAGGKRAFPDSML